MNVWVCLWQGARGKPAHNFLKESAMEGKDIKKILAGLGIATLVSAVGVTVPSNLHAGSG